MSTAAFRAEPGAAVYRVIRERGTCGHFCGGRGACRAVGRGFLEALPISAPSVGP